MALRFVAFLALVVGLSALIVAVVFRAVHFSGRPGAVLVVTVLTFFWLAWLTAIGARLLRRTAAPIADMMDAARHVERGDYAPRVQVRGSRDVRRLAMAFNAMTERLASNEERRRNLLADIAHELRTPLSVIQGHTEGMLDELYPADRTHLEPLLEETRVMARLLDDLQTLSTAEAGALQLHREAVEPRQLVEEAVATFGSNANRPAFGWGSWWPRGCRP